jgi:hypothetical protein
MCVASWANVDRRLYQIFHHATGFEQKQSALLYYRNRAFNQRLRLVDDAVRATLEKEQYEQQWKPIHRETEDLWHTRNIFAHHPTLRSGTSRDGKPFDNFSIYIEPYERILNNDYPGLLGKKRLEVGDLIRHETEVAQLETKLATFNLGNWGLASRAKGRRVKLFPQGFRFPHMKGHPAKEMHAGLCLPSQSFANLRLFSRLVAQDLPAQARSARG